MTITNSSSLPEAKIYVAGHSGLAGSAILRRLQRNGYNNIVIRTRTELDLRDRAAVHEFFLQERPQVVFLAAAKVGGILANNQYPADFIINNLEIETNVISSAYESGVDRLMFLGSSCIYPRDCPQPIKEEFFMTGSLEATNRPYAVAKIAGIEMCWAFNRQYGTQYLGVMPTNLYGPNDNYDLQTSHVVAALLRKMHEAKLRQDKAVSIWGTGTIRREFLHSDDMADACVYLMGLPDEVYQSLILSEVQPPILNVGSGHDVTIRELAEEIRDVVAYHGELHFDGTKPDGAPRKLLDVSRIKQLGWQYSISLPDGLVSTYSEMKRRFWSRV